VIARPRRSCPRAIEAHAVNRTAWQCVLGEDESATARFQADSISSPRHRQNSRIGEERVPVAITAKTT